MYSAPLILNKDNPETIPTLVEILKEGGTAVLPCDTIYGLSAIYGAGEGALRALKGRSETKPFLVIATMDQAKELIPEIPQEILDAWPAPLTAVLNTADGGTLAVRVPDDTFLQRVLFRLGSPLYSTSVNISGEPSLLDFRSIRNRFESYVDVIVRGMEIQGTTPSTLVDATSRPFRVLRQGSFILK